MITPDIDDILQHYPDATRDALIPLLQDVQEQHGYLSREAVVQIGKHLHLPASKIYGVATFYNQFRFQPQGKFHVQVCRGTACHVKGSAAILDAVRRELKVEPGQTSRDGLFSLEVVACIGACGLAPVICVNGEFHAGVTTQSVAKILDSYRKKAVQDGNGQKAGSGMEDSDGNGHCSCDGHANTASAEGPCREQKTTAAFSSSYGTYPELLAWIMEDADGQDQAARQGREQRLAELRRECLVRPAIFVGAGTCGLGAGAQQTLDAVRKYLDTHEIKADVIKVGCIGLCSAEPMVDIQLPGRTRLVFSHVTADAAPHLLEAVLRGTIPEDNLLGQHRSASLEPWPNVPYMDEHPFFAPQTRWVLANCGIIDPAEIDEYIAHGGYRALARVLRTMTPDQVCDMVEASGLRGRGGGGFPTGKKWKFARQTPAGMKYLVCNADEGDPGAFMDRAVIEGDPHRLVEGMAIAAYGIGASKAYVYIRAEYPLAIKRLKAAIAQAEANGLLGENILGSGFGLKIVIKMGAGAFVCGEETALMQSIEGKRGMPRPRPPFPAVAGLFSKPTIINNVETLANLPTLAAQGASWFAAVGTKTSKGTKVFALSGKVSRTGLVEVAMGTKVRQIVFDIGGGIPNGRKYKSVQIGGPSGGCIPEQHLDIDVDYESLKTVGAMMGSGGLVVMDEDTCMVDVAKFFMDFIQRESCGKCIPCREGTRRMLEILQRITRGRRREKGIDALDRFNSVLHLQSLAESIRDTSLCGLGQTAPNPVLSTLRWFRHEYEAHIFERRCPSGVCPELVTFSIDPAKCKGCTLCAKKCPADAITGATKAVHHIIQDQCIGCGTCMDACRFGAIVKK